VIETCPELDFCRRHGTALLWERDVYSSQDLSRALQLLQERHVETVTCRPAGAAGL
jgi:hypothetical protein